MPQILEKIEDILLGNTFQVSMNPFEQGFFKYPFYFMGFGTSQKAYDLKQLVDDEDMCKQLLTFSFYLSHLKEKPKQMFKNSIESLRDTSVFEMCLKITDLCRVFCIARNVDNKLKKVNKTKFYFRKTVHIKKNRKRMNRFKKIRWADEIGK